MSLTGAVAAHNHSSAASGGVLPLWQLIAEYQDRVVVTVMPAAGVTTTIVTITALNLQVDDVLDIRGKITGSKGASAGRVIFFLVQLSGTGTVSFLDTSGVTLSGFAWEADQQDIVAAAPTLDFAGPFATTAKCTVAGTAEIAVRVNSANSGGAYNLDSNVLNVRHFRPTSSA